MTRHKGIVPAIVVGILGSRPVYDWVIVNDGNAGIAAVAAFVSAFVFAFAVYRVVQRVENL